MTPPLAPPVVVALVGPTGAGKTALAVEVAERLAAEVVAVDAFTVYRGMDVGTAKPGHAERARVRHHLLDVLDPTQDCTVEWFQAAARSAIADVRARGRAVVLVGGSGLYFRAVVDPLEFPPTDPAVRARVEQRFAGDPAAAHAELARVDPDAAARMDPGNLRRAVRALEVLELTGRPFSSWRRAWDRYESVYPELTAVGVDVPRPTLVARLDRRVEAMFAGGLLDEARALSGLALSATARQAIGYAEALAHVTGRTSVADAVETTKVRTRRYAARQARWFARDPRVRWVTPGDALRVLATH